MNTIMTIFKKELTDTLRDRRTLIIMFIIPFALLPVMFTVMAKIGASQVKKAQDKELKVAYFANANESHLKTMLEEAEGIKLIFDADADSVEAHIRTNKLDAAIIFAPNFSEKFNALKPGKISVFYQSTNDANITWSRLKKVIDQFEKDLLEQRFISLNLNKNTAKVLRLEQTDVATAQEKYGKMIGGFLPYIFILFCFMGSMYPAIDLAAGEKERGTIETLLSSPANRFQIIVGKFLVVVISGCTSAIATILGMLVATKIGDIPEEITNVLGALLEPKSVILVLSLLIPLTVFLAGILLSISIFAKSFKEAQSLITPGNILVILPAAIGMVPGITLNYGTALIPVLNVSLATKEILAGTLQYDVLIVVYISQIVLALLSLWFCSKWFEREEIIFRE
ncbi:MAG: ABC transporter permease [Calditrichaeota bacterium]|nr:MAG: ABC transporter permease [Calditrichota bacterium]